MNTEASGRPASECQARRRALIQHCACYEVFVEDHRRVVGTGSIGAVADATR